ncbi:MAG: FMN-binding protein [Acidimicrobiia bacterium]|nr:FMN-binding protein [Acidimicrobiia bacterium]
MSLPRHRVIVATTVMALAASAVPGAQIATRDEALKSAYPGAAIRTEQVFLTAAQRTRATELAGGDAPASLVVRYVAVSGDRPIGRAYVDTHVVRTKKETLLVCLDAAGSVTRIETTAFLEPPEYLAPEPWVRQYLGRGLGDDVEINRAIRPMAGATLTARAINAAVRRVLALDRVLEPSSPERAR